MKNEKLIYGIILVAIFSLSLYIRGVIPYESVISNSFVKFGGNDPYYNYRLVETALHNFPSRMFSDFYTFYPHGAVVPFALLFDYSLACIIWIIGFGDPYNTLGEHGIKTIFAFYPAILGALCIFPTYFIGKHLWNKNAGIIAALVIAVLPGQFLSRSLLGFTDHHIMEVLLSTVVMVSFIYVLSRIDKNKITFKCIKEDSSLLKKPLFYSLLLGIVLGTFYLSWSGAPLFVFIIMIYSIIQHTVNHLREKDSDYLSIITVPSFIVALIMILPLLLTPFKGFVKFQILSLVLGIITFAILTSTSTILKRVNIDKIAYPIALIGIGILSIIFVSLLLPNIYSEFTGKLSTLTPAVTTLTIQEATPMKMPHIMRWFSTTFFVAILGFAVVGWNIIKKFKDEEILFLVWSLVILYACFGQNRFAYYYAVNVALLCGLVSMKLIEYVSPKSEKAKPKVKGKKNRKKIIKKIPFYKNYTLLGVCGLIFLVVIIPPLNISLTTAKHTGGINNDWYNSLIWLRDNTPELDIDYYGIYENDFTYPDSTYSIMSWWDYGHWITTIAHRIPIANPFQQGARTAAGYLIETDETKANEILDELDTKYVIIDYPMADFMGTPTYPNPKYVMPTWAGKNPNPFQTVMVRLHYFDGSEVLSENIPALQHYRLIYESEMFVLPYMIIDAQTNRVLGWQAYHGAYEPIKNDLHKLHQGAMIQNQQGLIAKAPEFFHPFGFVKIFEYIPEPYIIEGIAPINSSVTASTLIKSNQGREFFYNQTVISNGEYKLYVPYSGEYKIIVKENDTILFVERRYIE